MSTDTLSLVLLRLEFALSASFHYLFVPLSLGLVLAICALEAGHVRTGRAAWADAAHFWRRYFLLAWAAGVATGYPLRWQMQKQWQGYADHVREVLHAIMTLEGWIAPLMFALVGLLGLAGRRLGARTRLALSTALLLAMMAQAAGILTLNAWMQHPVGTRATPGGAQLVSLAAVLANPYAHTKIAHTLSASVVTGAFFMLALAGRCLLRRRHLPMARVSMQLALPMALLGVAATIHTGHESALDVAQHQPMKFAAMEAHWHAGEREHGGAPLVLWGWPDQDAQANRLALELPGAMAWLTGDAPPPAGVHELLARARRQIHLALQPGAPAELAGWRQLYEHAAHRNAQAWPALTAEQRLALAARASVPHVPTLFVALRLMAGLGLLLLVLLAMAWRRRHRLEADAGGRRMTRWLVACMPLPWVATLAGWVVAEVGRQPWIVYEQMPTARAAVLPAATAGGAQMLVLAAGCAVLGTLFAWACIRLLRHGPAPLPRPRLAAARASVARLLRAASRPAGRRAPRASAMG
jgi:cytochrome bd ubiquinol oxidase subunit I